MEALAVVGLVSNVIQLVDFSSKVLAKSTEIYKSHDGATEDDANNETATTHLVLLVKRVKNDATTTSDATLRKLCDSCTSAADELLAALRKVKVNGKQNRWRRAGKALRSAWSKDKILELERRLARLREELNLHIGVDLREQVLRLQSDHADRFANLDSMTQRVIHAVVQQQDVFNAIQDTQVALMNTLQSEMVLRIKDEHATTRDQIIDETVANNRAEHAFTQSRIIEEIAINDQAEHAITRREIIQEFRRHEQQTLSPGPREPCWSVPLSRNRHFVGRTSKIDEIETNLFREGYSSKVAIIGLGGIGKTQIALEIAHRTREKRPECSIFWIFASSTENVRQAYLGIAQQLQIPGFGGDSANVEKLVQNYLSQESAGQWLLVFDNVDDLDMWLKPDNSTTSTRLIDSLPRSNKGSMLFTTRNRKVASKFARSDVFHIDEMDEETATLVLSNSLTNKSVMDDSSAVVQLLKLLTFLPLAIVQAAAYINENDLSLLQYVSLFDESEENVIDVLSEEFEDEGRYRDSKNPIAATWLISFEQIRVRDPFAGEYLSFMSCIDPKAVPLSLLPPGQTKKQELDAIGTLKAYSFIVRRSEDQLLEMHRLVHIATRNWLREQGLLTHWTKNAIARLAEIFPDNDHRNRSTWQSYLPHARYVQASEVFKADFEANLDWYERFSGCLFSDGRYEEARVVCRQVLAARMEAHGQEYPGTLVSMGNMANILKNLGQYQESEELLVPLVDISKRVLGDEDPQTITDMSDLATTFWLQRKWAKAEELNLQVLEVRKRIFGDERPETLLSMSLQASIYQDQGRLPDAMKITKQVVEMSETILGKEHLHTLIFQGNLASTYQNLGQLKEAEDLEVYVIETKKKVLGEDHPSTLRTMNNLAHTLGSQKRYGEAIPLMETCCRLQKQVLGSDHPDTKDSLQRLNRWQKEMQDIDQKSINSPSTFEDAA